MLRSRLIPCLLIKNDGLVKTRRFGEPKYVGDPINAIRIFNEKRCDELLILDIDATVHGRAPDLAALKKFALESRMPLCYGGGINSLKMASEIVGLGIEKIALSSAAISNPALLGELANALGTQSVVVVLDYRMDFLGRRRIFTHNGRVPVKAHFWDTVESLKKIGVGEIVFNCIDRDGMQSGLDAELAIQVRKDTSTPFTVMGGARDLTDIADVCSSAGPLGIGVGSLFVFKGKYRAVLINYPDIKTKQQVTRGGLLDV